MSDSERPSVLEQLGITEPGTEADEPTVTIPTVNEAADETATGDTGTGDRETGNTEGDGTDAVGSDGKTRRRRRKWPFIVAAAVVVVVAGAIVAWQLRAASASSASRSRTQTYTISSQTLKQTVGTTGTIEPAQQSELSFSSSGTVTSVDVAVGDKVTKGDMLATIDDTSLRADVNSAKASVKAAKEDLSTLQDDDDSTSASISNAKAQLKLKKSELASARDALAAATLKAPFTGLVAEVGITKGDSVGSSSSSGGTGSTSGSSGSSDGSSSSGSGSGGSSGSSSSSSSSDSITMISNNSWIVDTTVSSADLASVKKGLQAQITPTSGGDTIYGTVSSVGVMADSDSSGSSTFPVTIKVTGSPDGLYAGTSASVSIIVKQIQNALVVPTLAVKTVNGNTVVEKVVDGKSVQTKITTGDSYGSQTVIKSGLSAGDKVTISISMPGGSGSRSGSSSRSGSQSQEGSNTGSGGFPGSGSGGFPGGGSGGGFSGGGGQGNR